MTFLYLSLKALKYLALSLLSSIFCKFKNLLETIGINSTATIIEAPRANIIENAIPANTFFVNPSYMTIGKNTQTEVIVDAIIGIITSFVPRTAATLGGSLYSCIWSNMLSNVTTELSTKDPTARASPIREIIFNEIP